MTLTNLKTIKTIKTIKKRGVVKTALGTHFVRTLLNLAYARFEGQFLVNSVCDIQRQKQE